MGEFEPTIREVTPPPHDLTVPLINASGHGFDPTSTLDGLASWLRSPSLAALVASFDGPTRIELGTDVEADLAWLSEFSTRWDFRGGKERNRATAASFTPEQEALVTRAATDLGLRGRGSHPSARRYSHCLVLGGLVRACLLRPQWAATLVTEGYGFGQVTALAAFRPLGGDEPQLAELVGWDDITTEFEAMDRSVRAAFGTTQEPTVRQQREDNPNSSWSVNHYAENGIPPLAVVAAPSSQPATRRANTPDTYRWWAEQVAELTPEDSVLLITNGIYVPFQHAGAVNMLARPYGCAVETIGIPDTLTGTLPRQQFATEHYLQEIRSAINTMQLLARELPADTDSRGGSR